jgi:hypothetical protein
VILQRVISGQQDQELARNVDVQDLVLTYPMRNSGDKTQKSNLMYIYFCSAENPIWGLGHDRQKLYRYTSSPRNVYFSKISP